MSASVSACYYYPLKSGKGIATNQLELTKKGPKFDRLWMLVDENGLLISQRTKGCEKLALVTPQVDNIKARFSAPGMDDLALDVSDYDYTLVDALIHGNDCKGYDAGKKAEQWFQEYLGIDCKLLVYNNNEPRGVDPEYGAPGDEVSFADGMPLLVTSMSSLNSLSQHFPENINIGMDRFRPNIVIEGIDAFEEDVIHHLRIGDVELEFVKPCARCILTTVDQQSGEKNTGNEPVTTLTKTRRGMGGGLKGVFFGQNAIPRALGTVNIGDKVEILDVKPMHPALEQAVLRYQAA